MSLYYVIVSWSAIDRHDWLWSGARGLLFWRKVLFEMPRPPPKRKNYKGRNPNTLRYIESCGTEANPANLASGARLAEENEGQAVGEKTFILTG